MNDVYNNIDDYNPRRKRKILIVFDDLITEELFIRCRKLNISLIFITQSCYSLPKDVRLSSTHYLIMKIHDGRELQNIANNHSADIDYKDIVKIYRNCTNEPFSFLTVNTTLPADSPRRFRNNFSDSLL